ncbi:MAG: hypothetical protein ACLFTK_07760 [Anaerolineales bacterium]
MLRVLLGAVGLWIGLGLGLLAWHAPQTPAHVARALPDDTCAVPCWRGIWPGQTTDAEAAYHLARLPDTVPARVGNAWHIDEAPYTHTVTWLAGSGELMIGVQGVRLADALLAFGPPKYYFIQTELAGRIRNMLIFWPEQRVRVVVRVQDFDQGRGFSLRLDTPISSIKYLHAAPARPPNARSWVAAHYVR